MGVYKQIQESDILYNNIVTKPYHLYMSGNDGLASGSLMLYKEPFDHVGSHTVYIGLEEGDVRTEIDKHNASGTIALTYMTSSLDSKYCSFAAEMSASQLVYTAHISGIKNQQLTDVAYLIDVSSVYYDKKITDFVYCTTQVNWSTRYSFPEGSKPIIETANYKFAAQSGSLVVYHDLSGALKIGSYKYFDKNDDGQWEYNIAASMADSGPVAVWTDYGGIPPIPTSENVEINTVAGYIIPEQGLAVLTHRMALSATYMAIKITKSPPPVASMYMFAMRGHHDIPVNTYLCHADRGELNYSNNPTFYKSGSQGQMYHSGSNLVYITKIGLYDKDRRLIGVASMGQPIR